MARVLFMKSTSGALVPQDPTAVELMGKLKLGQPVWVDVVRARNTLFHAKWFALLGLAFEAWEPPVVKTGTFAGMQPEKDFDKFRKDLTIQAGFYDVVATLDGRARVEAKSVSFDKMSPDDFERLYSASIDVILKLVMRDKTGPELRAWVDAIMRFD